MEFPHNLGEIHSTRDGSAHHSLKVRTAGLLLEQRQHSTRVENHAVHSTPLGWRRLSRDASERRSYSSSFAKFAFPTNSRTRRWAALIA